MNSTVLIDSIPDNFVVLIPVIIIIALILAILAGWIISLQKTTNREERSMIYFMKGGYNDIQTKKTST